VIVGRGFSPDGRVEVEKGNEKWIKKEAFKKSRISILDSLNFR